MAPALRMTRSIKEKLPIFFEVFLFLFYAFNDAKTIPTSFSQSTQVKL